MESEELIHHGNCHCGSYRFELRLPEIKDVATCDCDLCKKQGYLWIVPPEDSFSVVRDEGKLVEYNSSALSHKASVPVLGLVAQHVNGIADTKQFCGVCGTGILGTHLEGPLQGKTIVNIRNLRGINPFGFE